MSSDTSSSPMTKPRPSMNQHDPNDDPFAALSSEFDSNMMTLPTEYGSGAIDPTKKEIAPSSSPKEEEAEQEENVSFPSSKEDENAPKP